MIRIALLSPAVGTPNVGDQFIEDAVRRLLRDDVTCSLFTTRRLLTERELADIADCDCALLCGTNLYQHDWHSALTPAIVKRMDVPVIPVGVGGSAASLEDRAVSERTRQMILTLHDRCALGSVRDEFTAAVVADLGVDNAILTGCPVLFWSRQSSLPEPDGNPKKRLVLTSRNWLMHRWPDAVDHPVQISLLKRIITRFRDLDLVFAIHEDWDASLVERLEIPETMVFRGARVEDFTSLYTDRDNVVFAMRLHAGMLALANGVSTLFIGHDTRTYSFCKMLALPYVELFEADAASVCIRELERLLAGEPGVPARAFERFGELHASMTRFLLANGLPAGHAVA